MSELKSSQNGEVVSMHNLLVDYQRELSFLIATGHSTMVIPTGFTDIDRIFSPRRGGVTLLAGKTGVGKTSLGLNIGLQSADRFRSRVAFFSMEMKAIGLVHKAVSAYSGVDSIRIHSGSITTSESRKIMHAVQILEDLPVQFDDSAQQTMNQLVEKIENIQQESGLDLVVVDRVEMLSKPKRVSDLDKLRQVATELNIGILALTNTLTSPTSKKRNLYAENAEAIWFLHRDDQDNRHSEKQGIAEVHIIKNRYGPTGQISLLLNARTGKFLDLEVYP